MTRHRPAHTSPSIPCPRSPRRGRRTLLAVGLVAGLGLAPDLGFAAGAGEAPGALLPASPPAALAPGAPGAPGAPTAAGPTTASALDLAAPGVALTRAWRASGNAADLKAVESPMSVLFPYGHGHPVLRCAPLRACAVELEPAETVLATAAGDSERWIVQTAGSGAGGRTLLVLVKPTACDISTNLVIATDRRVYELTLDSPPCRDAPAGTRAYNPRLPYTGLLRFYYPDDLVRRWAAAGTPAGSAGVGAASDSIVGTAAARTAGGAGGGSGGAELAPGIRLAQLNFDYRWQRDRRFPWTPSQVFDDGEHTYILLPPAALHAEAPVLLAEQPDGSLALLNYRLEGQTYIADRVLDRAVLALGTGKPTDRKSRQSLEIVNHASHRQRPVPQPPAETGDGDSGERNPR